MAFGACQFTSRNTLKATTLTFNLTVGLQSICSSFSNPQWCLSSSHRPTDFLAIPRARVFPDTSHLLLLFLKKSLFQEASADNKKLGEGTAPPPTTLTRGLIGIRAQPDLKVSLGLTLGQ